MKGTRSSSSHPHLPWDRNCWGSVSALRLRCDLVRWRADIHARHGETARARADLEAVLAAVQRLPAGAAPRRGSWMVWLELASLAAREGQLDRAREAVEAAKASSTMPLLVGDIVRARPELAAL